MDYGRTRSLGEHRRELQTRFTLLKEQYESDLERLALVEQAGGRLEQLSEERCPVCGAAGGTSSTIIVATTSAPVRSPESCRPRPPRSAVRDLDATIAANEAELSRLGALEAEQTGAPDADRA